MLGCAAGMSRSEDLALTAQALETTPADTDIAIAASAAAGVAPLEPFTDPIVRTGKGILRGKPAGASMMFLGIPYAQPPVGALRFRAPQPMTPWSGTRSAETVGPVCPQLPAPFAAQGPQSEDCLSLNVYVPFKSKRLPVMVFLHGGGFVAGTGSQFSGLPLAQAGNVIVVTINYRLGALGFLTLPQLDAERGSVPSGNDAIRDQQLALSWVRDNIAVFGGDPAQVTVFGESAGAISTCLQMVSPLSRTLAKRFILESGSCEIANGIATPAQARNASTQVVNALCAGRSDVLPCLRALPAGDIAALPVTSESLFSLTWRPVVNPADPLLPQQPMAMIAAGNYNKGELIIGSNARELGLFQLQGAVPFVTSVAQLNAVLDGIFGPASSVIKQQYSAASDAQANATFVRLGTDLLFRCPARQLARRTSGQGSPVFLYHFEEGDAFHMYELPYVFGIPNASLGAPTLVEATRFEVQSRFTNFARIGQPPPPFETDVLNPDFVAWPGYSTATDQHLSLKANVTAGVGLSKADCDFLVSIGAVQ
jgi:para-nitrobenzyl esterase